MTQPTREDPPIRPPLPREYDRPQPYDEWHDRAFLAFVIAGCALTAGGIAVAVIRVVREHPLEFVLGALAVSAVAWVAWLAAGVLLRREEARRQR